MAGDPERSAHAHAATPVIGPVNAFPRRQARDMAGLIRRDTVPVQTAHRSTDSCYPSSSARRSPSRAPRAQPGRTSPWARLPQSRVLSNDTCSISSVTGTKPGAGWACAAADARENGSRRQGAPDEAGNRTVDRRPCSHHDNPFCKARRKPPRRNRWQPPPRAAIHPRSRRPPVPSAAPCTPVDGFRDPRRRSPRASPVPRRSSGSGALRGKRSGPDRCRRFQRGSRLIFSTPPASAASQMVWPLLNGHGRLRFLNVTVSASAGGSPAAGRLNVRESTRRDSETASAPRRENRSV